MNRVNAHVEHLKGNKLSCCAHQPVPVKGRREFKQEVSPPQYHHKLYPAEDTQEHTHRIHYCESAMSQIKGLEVLNDCNKNWKILAKLPGWLTLRWNRKVIEVEEESQTFPSFRQFVKFLTCGVKIACNPITSLHALKPNKEEKSKVVKNRSPGAKALTTSSDENGNATSFYKIIPLPVTYSREFIPANRNHIPTPETAKAWSHLEHIADEIAPQQSCDVGLLIGYNCPQALVPRQVVPGEENQPFAQRTDLGWSVVGYGNPCLNYGDAIGVSHQVIVKQVIPGLQSSSGLTNEVHYVCRTQIKEVILPANIIKVLESDFAERASEANHVSQEDLRFLSKLKEGIIHKSDGHYEMPLPFKKDRPDLPDNKVCAIHRLKCLERKLRRDEQYNKDYKTFMDEIITHGDAEKVPEEDIHKTPAWNILEQPSPDVIQRNFYVDDGLSSVASTSQAIQLVKEARELCSTGKLRLHKFVSNSKEVLATIPKEERGEAATDKDMVIKEKPLTRRGVLATVASVYDPLGFVAPFVLVGKQILQQMCWDKLSWDDTLPDDLRPQWERWLQDLQSLADVKIPSSFKAQHYELHHFSDASVSGYGACSYLRAVSES
ncbi:hypothetical protein NFI96_021031, partial [Prochilodus magdalenae]